MFQQLGMQAWARQLLKAAKLTRVISTTLKAATKTEAANIVAACVAEDCCPSYFAADDALTKHDLCRTVDGERVYAGQDGFAEATPMEIA